MLRSTKLQDTLANACDLFIVLLGAAAGLHTQIRARRFLQGAVL
jgi:hypothetical protein